MRKALIPLASFLVLFATFSGATAGSLVDSGPPVPPPGGPSGFSVISTQFLAQQFTLPVDATITEIAPFLFKSAGVSGALSGPDPLVRLQLTNAIGPGTPATAVLADFSLTVSNILGAFVPVSLPVPLQLRAGTYFLVASSNASLPGAVPSWGSSAPNPIGTAFIGGPNSPFPPAITFSPLFDGLGRPPIFGLRIGDTVVSGLYDDFSEERLDPDRWVGVEVLTSTAGQGITLTVGAGLEAIRSAAHGKLRLAHRVVAGTGLSIGITDGRNRLVFAKDAEAIKGVSFGITARSFDLLGCTSVGHVSRVRAGFNSLLFRDPVALGNPGLTANVGAVIELTQVSDSTDPANVLRARGILYRCGEPSCGFFPPGVATTVDLGAVRVHEDVNLRLSWDPTNKKVDFQKDDEPAQSLAYATPPFNIVNDANPPSTVLKTLEARGQVANCTESPRPFAEINTLFENIVVNP